MGINSVLPKFCLIDKLKDPESTVGRIVSIGCLWLHFFEWR